MLALAAAVGAATAPAAIAADGCPNAALREQQGATQLPDCRAYEVVSPAAKNGNTIAAGLMPRASGGAVAYWSTGAFAGAASNISGNYVGERTAEGWTTRALNPPTLSRNPVLMDQFYLVAMSQDFSRSLIETRYPVDPLDAQTGDFANIGRGDLYSPRPDGSFAWISQPARVPDTISEDIAFGSATDDFGVIAMESAKPLTPEVPDGSTEQQVYVRDGDTTRLVSVAPGGGPLPDGASIGGVLWGGTATGSRVGGAYPSALSADGQTVWFSTSANALLPQLYVRTDALDPAAAATTQVSSSQASGTTGDDCQTKAEFLAAREDGEAVWFACGSRLTDDAPAGGGVYSWTRADGRLRFLTPDLGGSDDAGASAAFVAADDDVDHLWFTSQAQLAPGAPLGTGNNLYVLEGDTVTFVAALDYDPMIPYNLMLSPDGSQLAFTSLTQLDANAGGLMQVYSFDADDPGAGVVCVSCRPDGSPSEGLADLGNAGVEEFTGPNRVPPFGAVGADGTVFFTSRDRLLPADDNGDAADVYMYRDGDLTLLSSGRDRAGAVFAGASADSADVFLITAERLAPQDTDNGVADIYSVRAGGGFAATVPAQECAEDCQGPLRAPFAPGVPASGTFTGPGNVEDPVPPAAATFRVGTLGAAQRRALARSGRTTLTVRASQAGTVRAIVRARLGGTAVVVARASRTLEQGGTAKLTLRLSARARAQLRRRHRLTLTVTVSHSRVRGSARTSLTLLAPKAKRTNGGGR